MKKAQEIKLISSKRLKECRIENKLTLEKLSSLSDYSIQTLHKIETGKRALSEQVALACAEALNVRKEYLLGIDDFKTEKSKTWNSIGITINKYKCFNVWIESIGILQSEEPIDMLDTDEIIGYEEINDYDGNGSSASVPVHGQREFYDIEVLGEKYILSTKELALLESEIEEYAKFRFQSMGKHYTEANKKIIDRGYI